MIKLIIVDDESSTIRGIKRMINRQQTGFVVVGEAMDGNQGIRIATDLSPDVIITDIRMPNLNGIEMMKQIKAKLPKTKFVVLSGYGEFDYAQEAIKVGAIDYLLKPISSKNFYPLLEKIKSIIDIEKHNKKEVSRIQAEKELQKLLFTGRLGTNQIIIQNKKYNIEIITLEREIFDNNSKLFLESLEKRVEKNKGVLHNIDKYKILILVSEESIADIVEFNYKILNDAKKVEINIKINSIKSSCRTNNIQIMYEKLLEFEQLNFYFDNRSGVRYLEGNELTNINIELLDGLFDIDNIVDLVQKNDVKKVIDLFKKAILIFEINRVKVNDVRLYIYDVTRNVIDKLLVYDMISEYQLIAMDNDIQEILVVENKKKLEDLLFNIYSKTKNYKEDNLDISKKKVVSDIKKFIRRNFDKDIGLNDVADFINLNPKYVSDLFKKEAGINYTNYLRKIRIIHSKELLEHSNLKIYEISNKVGYKTSKHFIKVFKIETGFTPNEYREKYKK
ncbi:MAG: response regulator transcription factor [Pleomorphochaeta sp.]